MFTTFEMLLNLAKHARHKARKLRTVDPEDSTMYYIIARGYVRRARENKNPGLKETEPNV